MARPSHIVFVSVDEPGFSRRPYGRGSAYYNEKKKKIKDPKTIKRIKNLVIPPMWTDVWICPDENGNLQATGIDAKNRKQYLYHPDWTAHRRDENFGRMYSFGKKLSDISKSYTADLRRHGWPKEKVIALVVYLLDNHYFRIGNLRYTKQNQSYGLTTLRRKHLLNGTGKLVISYRAKSGKHRKVKIENRSIAKKIMQISELPGYAVFSYLDDDGIPHKIDSGDINNYLYNVSGDDFTAKDFRTWGASKLALDYYDETNRALADNPRLRFETTLVKKVAQAIGNTVSTCRKYYIHPAVLEFLCRHHPKPLAELIKLKGPQYEMLDEHENYLLHLLKKKK